ncbi:MAG: alpha/beta hydrolase, partial [Chromatiales bacterium]|nr:alpha/beta hydrolase [Chromatiales bacterium]
GGLFAALVHLGGAPAVGLALINTLRKDGPRLSWINAAVTQAARVGGPALLMDLYAPMLFAEPWLAANRASALDAQAYVPADETTGAFMLLASGGSASWDVPWDRIQVPTLVLTGLRDRVFYVEDDVDNISSRMAAATRVNFDDAGHLIPIEQPAALARELLSLATRCD